MKHLSYCSFHCGQLVGRHVEVDPLLALVACQLTALVAAGCSRAGHHRCAGVTDRLEEGGHAVLRCGRLAVRLVGLVDEWMHAREEREGEEAAATEPEAATRLQPLASFALIRMRTALMRQKQHQLRNITQLYPTAHQRMRRTRASADKSRPENRAERMDLKEPPPASWS